MSAKGEKETNRPRPVDGAEARPSAVSVNVRKHLDQRKATAAYLDRFMRVFVTTREFGPSGMEARVLIGRRYYDVNERQLNRLRSGTSADELGLEEVDPE